MIKRYESERVYDGPTEEPDGEFVLYADHIAELEALRADALRYRWLTEGKRRDWCWNNVLFDDEKADHATLEAAIDEARKAAP